MRNMDEILTLVCDFLNREKIDYVVVGGLAVIFHGIPRTTMDVDMILQIEEEEIARFVEFLGENGFFTGVEDMKTAFEEKSHCTVQDKRSMIRLDVKEVYDEMDRRTLRRRITFEHMGTRIYLASPEDIVANKLVFGSEQDIRDAEGIYVRQMNSLDKEYLEDICRKMGVHGDFLKMKNRVEKHLEEK